MGRKWLNKRDKRDFLKLMSKTGNGKSSFTFAFCFFSRVSDIHIEAD